MASALAQTFFETTPPPDMDARVRGTIGKALIAIGRIQDPIARVNRLLEGLPALFSQQGSLEEACSVADEAINVLSRIEFVSKDPSLLKFAEERLKAILEHHVALGIFETDLSAESPIPEILELPPLDVDKTVDTLVVETKRFIAEAAGDSEFEDSLLAYHRHQARRIHRPSDLHTIALALREQVDRVISELKPWQSMLSLWRGSQSDSSAAFNHRPVSPDLTEKILKVYSDAGDELRPLYPQIEPVAPQNQGGPNGRVATESVFDF